MKFNAETHKSLLELIREKTGILSNTKTRKLIQSGAVSVNQKVTKIPSAMVPVGTEIIVDFDHKKSLLKKTKEGFSPVYEDSDVIAFIKPPGLLSVARPGKKDKSLSNLIAKQYAADKEVTQLLYPINRVDQKASGIMLFAKSAKTEKLIRANWKNAVKRYYAFLSGVPKENEGHLTAHFRLNRIGRLLRVSRPEDGLKVSLNYRVMFKNEKQSVLKITLNEGPKNAIRALLAENKYPIAGDEHYGIKKSPINRFGLHLFSISFFHPIKKETVEIKTPMPTPFKKWFKSN